MTPSALKNKRSTPQRGSQRPTGPTYRQLLAWRDARADLERRITALEERRDANVPRVETLIRYAQSVA